MVFIYIYIWVPNHQPVVGALGTSNSQRAPGQLPRGPQGVGATFLFAQIRHVGHVPRVITQKTKFARHPIWRHEILDVSRTEFTGIPEKSEFLSNIVQQIQQFLYSTAAIFHPPPAPALHLPSQMQELAEVDGAAAVLVQLFEDLP